MDNKKISTLSMLGRKCMVSSNTLNEMFGLCKHLEPSNKLKEDIAFNKGIVDMFGATDDIVPNVSRIDTPTGFGGALQSSDDEKESFLMEDVSENECDNVVIKKEQPKDYIKRDYVEVENFEVI